MKKIFLLLIGITFFQLATAQNPYLTDYKRSFRINNLSTLSSDNIIVFGSNEYAASIVKGNLHKNQVQLFHPTFSFDWQSKRRNTHELELIDLVLNRESIKNYSYAGSKTFTDKTLQTAISLRYEYRINFCTNKESRWVPSIGFSFNPYYQNNRSFINDSSLSYQTGVQTMGIRVAFNPSVTYFITKRLYITAGFSLTMLDMSKSTFLNPGAIWQSGQKDKLTFNNSKRLQDMIEFRVGIGYRF